jgi:hypothetical protein
MSGLGGCSAPMAPPEDASRPDAAHVADTGIDATRVDASLDAGIDVAMRDAGAAVDAAAFDAASPDAALADASGDTSSDVGSDASSGSSDAGSDASAGSTDAGFDAGSANGVDAGSDAASLDAGPGCNSSSLVCHDDRGTWLEDVYVAPDGTTTLAGYYQNAYLSRPPDGLLVQLAPSGTLRWQSRLGGSAADSFVEVLPIGSDLVAIGNTRSHSAGGVSQAWLARFDVGGNVLSEMLIGDPQSITVVSAIPTSDGGLLLVGKSLVASRQQLWAAKLDATLTVQWQIVGGTSGVDDGLSGAELSDGFLVAGRITYTSGTDAWILRLDRAGAVIWQARYNFINIETVRAVIPTSSGVYLVGDCNNHAWLSHIQLDGTADWSRTIDDTLVNEEVFVDAVAVGDDVIAFGDTASSTTWYDFFVVRAGPTGAIVWDRSIGGTSADRAGGIAPRPDGSEVLAGWSGSFGGVVSDPRSWLTHVGADGTVEMACDHAAALAFDDRVLTRVVTTPVFAAGTAPTTSVTSASVVGGVVCEPACCTP